MRTLWSNGGFLWESPVWVWKTSGWAVENPDERCGKTVEDAWISPGVLCKNPA